MKEQLTAALGLAPEASDEDIIAAVAALAKKCAEQEEAALNAEAEACADDIKDKISNREGFVRLYVKNRDAARAMLACLRTAAAKEVPATVCNKADARAPETAGFAACRTPEERCAFIQSHL